MILPSPPTAYRQAFFASVLQQIARLLTTSYQKNADIELTPEQRLILRSPNGTRYAITVDDAGNVSGTEVGA